MNNKPNGICAGGSYFAKDIKKPNAHQGSPTKRHNASKEQERLQAIVDAEKQANLDILQSVVQKPYNEIE